MSNDENVISIEETNRIRASLGLAPLKITNNNNNNDRSKSNQNEKEKDKKMDEEDESTVNKAAEIKRRIEQNKEKRKQIQSISGGGLGDILK